jgi:copper chaperone NosL
MIRRAFLFTVAVLAVACQTDQDRAVDPIWGKQPCEHCKMLVSHRASAAQLVHDGERYYFDDVGCMVQWIDEKKLASPRAWVRLGDGWVEADRATYHDGVMTPMDHGFVAGADGDVTWNDVRARVLAHAKGGAP